VTLFTAKVVTVADDYPYIFLIALVEPAPYNPGTYHVTGVLVQETVISSCPKRSNGLFRPELCRQRLMCGYQRRYGSHLAKKRVYDQSNRSTCSEQLPVSSQALFNLCRSNVQYAPTYFRPVAIQKYE